MLLRIDQAVALCVCERERESRGVEVCVCVCVCVCESAGLQESLTQLSGCTRELSGRQGHLRVQGYEWHKVDSFT